METRGEAMALAVGHSNKYETRPRRSEQQRPAGGERKKTILSFVPFSCREADDGESERKLGIVFARDASSHTCSCPCSHYIAASAAVLERFATLDWERLGSSFLDKWERLDFAE